MDTPFATRSLTVPHSSAAAGVAAAFPYVAPRYLWLVRSNTQHSCVDTSSDVVGGWRRRGRSRHTDAPRSVFVQACGAQVPCPTPISHPPTHPLTHPSTHPPIHSAIHLLCTRSLAGVRSQTLLLCLFPDVADSRAYRTALETVFPRHAVPGHDTDERLAVDELGISALWCAMHVGYHTTQS